MSTKPDNRLHLLLKLLRDFNDFTGPRMSHEHAVSQRSVERKLGDAVMFNLGWQAAKGATIHDLKGSASTERLLPMLTEVVEHANDLAKSIARLAESEEKLAAFTKPGRKKGAVADWNNQPGYQVVVAMIEMQPGKPPADHIRWGVKNGWLPKNIKDKTLARRIDLMRKRIKADEAQHLASIGANIVKFPAPKKRRPQ